MVKLEITRTRVRLSGGAAVSLKSSARTRFVSTHGSVQIRKEKPHVVDPKYSAARTDHYYYIVNYCYHTSLSTTTVITGTIIMRRPLPPTSTVREEKTKKKS